VPFVLEILAKQHSVIFMGPL